MDFLEVQIATRGYIPMINRRGPITNITLDVDTINQLIEDGVMVTVPGTGEPIAKVTVVDTNAEVVEEKDDEQFHIGMPEVSGPPLEKTGTALVEEEVDETPAPEPAPMEAVGADVPAPEEVEEDDGEEPAPVEGIPPYVPNPNLSKNQNKKAKKEYYAKMNAARAQSEQK